MMSIRQLIQGLHHVTATVDGAQDDIDFYVGVLGLRLAKKTVNFDNRRVYHFYYGNEVGTPGTLMTTFPYHGQGVPIGGPGTGQVGATAFSVPEGSLDAWSGRFGQAGLDVAEIRGRFGAGGLSVRDPSGLTLELFVSSADDRPPWVTEDIGMDMAIRGLHGVTLHVSTAAPTVAFLQEVLGFTVVDQTDACTRLAVGGDGAGHLVDVLEMPDAAPGVNGIGTVHHVALAVEHDDAQLAIRAELIERGVSVTPVMDRSYFHSIYFHEPGDVLLEVATIPPGFLIDEPVGDLGRALRLPAWEEVNRAGIEAGLAPVTY